MVFYKKVDVSDLKEKYGFSQQGLIAQEPIKKGERIWHCTCGEKDISFTRAQLLDIIHKFPKLDYFVRSFSYMIDDDIYAIPLTYLEEKNNDECAFFNHSCNSNCGFSEDAFGDNVVAIRDIEPGEELTYHYGILESESSLIYGLQCKCDSINCSGRLTFDYYRDPEFVEKHFDYMTPYLKQKVMDMKDRWYSSKCYVKRIPPMIEKPLEEWHTGLFALEKIKKDELVARFTNEVELEKHFLNNSSNPNCYIVGQEVFAKSEIPIETELTICL